MPDLSHLATLSLRPRPWGAGAAGTVSACARGHRCGKVCCPFLQVPGRSGGTPSLSPSGPHHESFPVLSPPCFARAGPKWLLTLPRVAAGRPKRSRGDGKRSDPQGRDALSLLCRQRRSCLRLSPEGLGTARELTASPGQRPACCAPLPLSPSASRRRVKQPHTELDF